MNMSHGLKDGGSEEKIKLHASHKSFVMPGMSASRFWILLFDDYSRQLCTSWFLVGQKLADYNEYCEPGEGAYEYANAIYAFIVGWVSIENFPQQEVRSLCVAIVDPGSRFINLPLDGIYRQNVTICKLSSSFSVS